MAKVSFTNFKLKVNENVEKFTIGDVEVEVLQYLPIADKYDLIMIALQNAEEDGIYNPLKLDMYLNLYLVFMYTNINFTDKQKEDLNKLYDILESNGIIDQVINLIPENEYNSILENMNEIIVSREGNKKTISGIISNLITELPKQAQNAASILESFDKEKFQEVIEFAKAANGGRDIN